MRFLTAFFSAAQSPAGAFSGKLKDFEQAAASLLGDWVNVKVVSQVPLLDFLLAGVALLAGVLVYLYIRHILKRTDAEQLTGWRGLVKHLGMPFYWIVGAWVFYF